MEMKSPPPCPATVTIRRNPPRKARATPSSAFPLRKPLSSPSLSRDIFATEIAQNSDNADCCKTDSSTTSLAENLKVFLRIRPLTVQRSSRTIPEPKNAWPKNAKAKSNSRPKTKKNGEICLQANEDLHSVTVSTPKHLQEIKRIKSEVYEGFSHVFSTESSQNDVYERMVKPLVEDFMKGKSGMLAAMGPSGSGKTHTVFGSAREPGMILLALRRIFIEDGREVYLSMFEISSERGKGEKMIDLLHDGGDVTMQHSVIKGLREVSVCDAQQAESLIARGMLKRATAMTNSNSQSSRSQCIINIRHGSEQGCEKVDSSASDTILTIVDLAGAEREKKTGNQGARLLESNFINNTSMVFGQCLRSLLEHQRNRNKTMQKHYKNSLLTRYLRDYLEGKKRMMLILTVKPGVEDYLDTSFLLRQASPFARIKFKAVEEPITLTNKRPNQALLQAAQLKKMKFCNNETFLNDEGKTDRSIPQNSHKDISGEAIEGCLNQNTQNIYDENIETHALSDGFVGSETQEKMSRKGNDNKTQVEKDRDYGIMRGLAKAMLKILREYKEKIEGLEIEKCHRRDSLSNEKTRTLGLENELTNAKMRILDLRNSLANEKTRSLYLENELTNGKMRILDLENEVNELKSRYTCLSKPSSDIFRVSIHGSNSDCSQYQMAETSEVNSDIVSPSTRGLEKTDYEKVADTSVIDSVVTFASCSDGGAEQHPQPQQLEDLFESGDDAGNMTGGDTSRVDVCFKIDLLSTSVNSSEELVCCQDMGTADMASTNEATIESSSRYPYTSCKYEQDAVSVVGDAKNLESEGEGIPSIIEASTSRLLCTRDKSEQDAANVVGGAKNLESESECALGESCLTTSTECENNKNTDDFRDAKEVKQDLTQFHNDMSFVEEQNVQTAAAHVHARPPQNRDTFNRVEKEFMLEPQGGILPKEGNMAKFVVKEKPRRRLVPASSVLLKDLGLLDIKDENDKPKGGKTGKTAATKADEKSRTQGSLSLLNLLTHR